MVINDDEIEKHKKRRKRGRWRFLFFSPLAVLGRMKSQRQGKGYRFYRYVKGFLWFCILLYLFIFGPDLILLLSSSPSSVKEDANASLHALPSTVSSSNFLSRSVEEANNSILRHEPEELLLPSGDKDVGELKVYIYYLPSSFNEDWLSNERCSKHLFAAEVAIHRALLGSSFRTLDPEEADFFFVPIYASCNFSTVNGFPAIGHARKLFASAVELISQSFPYWHRRDGADHVFVATHDFGACFHTMEDVAKSDGIPAFLRRSIILQTFGVKGPHPCQNAAVTVQIPPYVSPEAIEKALAERKRKRDIWVFFRGKMEIHPKNISGRVYSRGVRTAIWRKYSGKKRFYIKRERDNGYLSEIGRSVFCLCPLGWAPWSPRIVESVALGCVPVIIADGIRLPFPDAVPWSAISLTVPERDVHHLDRILSDVAATNLSTIQRNLRSASVRLPLLFHVPLRLGDATWQTLRSLTHHRSNNHMKLSSSYD